MSQHVQRSPNVFDVGPTLYKFYTNILCLLGTFQTLTMHERIILRLLRIPWFPTPGGFRTTIFMELF